MTIDKWLRGAQAQLTSDGIQTARLDSLVILENVTRKNKAWVLAHGDEMLDDEQLAKLYDMLERRAKREPLAYIRGRAWFYGRLFNVDERVLIPRPESEDIIDILKALQPSSVMDVGTGSGCLAITAALELPDCKISASDISPEALEIAQNNTRKLDADVEFFEASLLDNLQIDNYEVIVANLPYVPDGLVTSPEITREPAIALFAGEDGLDIYKTFWQQLSQNKPSSAVKYIITESLSSQHEMLSSLAQQAGFTLQETRGLIQLFKY